MRMLKLFLVCVPFFHFSYLFVFYFSNNNRNHQSNAAVSFGPAIFPVSGKCLGCDRFSANIHRNNNC